MKKSKALSENIKTAYLKKDYVNKEGCFRVNTYQKQIEFAIEMHELKKHLKKKGW